MLGGSVVYSALQAARLGLSAEIVGRANPVQLGPYWQPYAGEVGMHLEPAGSTTMFRNVSAGDSREQWLEGWAGEIQDVGHLPDSDILHIAPVAQEITLGKLATECRSRFVLLTPQGLVRRWDGVGARIGLVPRGFSAAVSSVVDVVRILVDPTGAGDCFAATLTSEVFRGQLVPEAVRLATAAASLCVSGQGAATIGGRQEIMSERGSSPGVAGLPVPPRPGG